VFSNIDMSVLTDEDIFKRIDQAMQKMGKAYTVGANVNVINQMQMIIQSYQFELSERAAKANWELNRKELEATIESDPEMANPSEDAKPEPKPRRRVNF